MNTLRRRRNCLRSDPAAGVFVARENGADTWKLALPPIKDRAVAIYYTFDEQAVILLWIVAFD